MSRIGRKIFPGNNGNDEKHFIEFQPMSTFIKSEHEEGSWSQGKGNVTLKMSILTEPALGERKTQNVCHRRLPWERGMNGYVSITCRWHSSGCENIGPQKKTIRVNRGY